MVLQRHELNGSEKSFKGLVSKNFSFLKNIFINTDLSYSSFSYFSFSYFLLPILPLHYLNFKVTTANTTVKIVTTQNLTAILLS
jgi:hypothetical protein